VAAANRQRAEKSHAAGALAAEVAENRQRRDYSPAEVTALADRLRAAGYRDGPGRPAKGTKALRPVLAAVIGRDLRTVRRTLNAGKAATARKDAPGHAEAAELRAAVAGLLRAVERLQTAAKASKRAKAAGKLAARLTFVVKAAPAVQAEAEAMVGR
jgi:type II secretory pathway component HofQ